MHPVPVLVARVISEEAEGSIMTMQWWQSDWEDPRSCVCGRRTVPSRTLGKGPKLIGRQARTGRVVQRLRQLVVLRGRSPVGSGSPAGGASLGAVGELGAGGGVVVEVAALSHARAKRRRRLPAAWRIDRAAHAGAGHVL